MYNIVIVGGGTGGMITAALAKYFYKSNVNVTVIFDHKNPNIGVGESLTPTIKAFLSKIGVDEKEMIKKVSSTIKLGLKFKNWLNDGNYYYHGFLAKTLDPDPHYTTSPYDIATGSYDSSETYSDVFYENCVIPNPRLTQPFTNSLHIDSVLFTNFLIDKFKNDITIIDDVVKDVIIENNNIKGLVLEKNGPFSGDFYIDASGFARVLMSKMKNEWVDKTSWLPLNKYIPQPVPTNWEDKRIPPYTTSEATDNGWILQVPLQNRWGVGYLYSSQFTTDEEAVDKFTKFLKDNYNHDIVNPKCFSFNSGYWKEQWLGNCIVTGLASGFAEPLEATNIQHTISQMTHFFRDFHFKVLEQDRIKYNNGQIAVYENIYLFIRFCYDTKRTDSEFWRYMTNNTPVEIQRLNERLEHFGYFSPFDFFSQNIFSYQNFTCVANGLNKFNKDRIMQTLNERDLISQTKTYSEKLKRKKSNLNTTAIDHTNYIRDVLNGAIS